MPPSERPVKKLLTGQTVFTAEIVLLTLERSLA